MLDKNLLDILACPVCKSEVSQDRDYIVCSKCGRRYPVKNGIPVMLADEAIMPNKGARGD